MTPLEVSITSVVHGAARHPTQHLDVRAWIGDTWIGGVEAERPRNSRLIWWEYNLWVAKPYRRQGVSTKLFLGIMANIPEDALLLCTTHRKNLAQYWRLQCLGYNRIQAVGDGYLWAFDKRANSASLKSAIRKVAG